MLGGLLAAGAGLGAGFRLPLVHAADYRGKLFVFVQADGGWDPTSFCDPKTNTPGEPIINHWAEHDEVRQAGEIAYAPFARNDAFFSKYHRRMLVINGVDAQTNSHTVGVTHNWSGRNSAGYPTMSALLAAHHAPDQIIAYLNFGGYGETGGLARSTRIDDVDLLRKVATPRVGMEELFQDEDWAALREARAAADRRLGVAPDLLPGDEHHRAFHRSALAAEGLKVYADALPPENEIEGRQEHTSGGAVFRSTLRRQAQLTVLAFKTGVAMSADLYLGGFDTHTKHDPDHEWLLGNLTDSVDYLWEYAEEHGVADRMVVVMGSDFGRTNFYNASAGKDHWPIGSYIVMEKGQRWTGQAVGETDALHFAQRIDPGTLRRDDRRGTIIYPKHVHLALRRYFDVADSPGAQRFPFNNTEDFAFFG